MGTSEQSIRALDDAQRSAVFITGLVFAGLAVVTCSLLLIFDVEGRDHVATLRRTIGMPNWAVQTAIIVLGVASIVAIIVLWSRAKRRDGDAASARFTQATDAAQPYVYEDVPELPPVDRWDRLGSRDWLLVLLYSAPLGFVVPFFVQSSTMFAVGIVPRISVAAVVAAVASAIAIAVSRARTPTVEVNTARRRIRAGKREAGWEELNTAELIILSPSQRRHALVLMLRAPTGLRIPLVLMRRGAPALPPDHRALARMVINGSSIAMPRAKEDPDGRFSRWNFPQNVSKVDAEALVTRPPAADDPLPIPE